MDEPGSLLIAGVTRLELRDFVQAYRRSPGQRLALVVLAAASCSAVGLLAWALKDHWPLPAKLLALFTAVFFVFMTKHAWSVGAILYQSLDEEQRQLRVELTEHGLRVRAETSTEGLDWESFHGWRESADAFVLEQRHARLRILPKRAFVAEEVGAVRRLLSARVVTRPPRLNRGRFAVRFLVVFLVVLLACSAVAAYQIVRHRRPQQTRTWVRAR